MFKIFSILFISLTIFSSAESSPVTTVECNLWKVKHVDRVGRTLVGVAQPRSVLMFQIDPNNRISNLYVDGDKVENPHFWGTSEQFNMQDEFPGQFLYSAYIYNVAGRDTTLMIPRVRGDKFITTIYESIDPQNYNSEFKSVTYQLNCIKK